MAGINRIDQTGLVLASSYLGAAPISSSVVATATAGSDSLDLTISSVTSGVTSLPQLTSGQEDLFAAKGTAAASWLTARANAEFAVVIIRRRGNAVIGGIVLPDVGTEVVVKVILVAGTMPSVGAALGHDFHLRSRRVVEVRGLVRGVHLELFHGGFCRELYRRDVDTGNQRHGDVYGEY